MQTTAKYKRLTKVFN